MNSDLPLDPDAGFYRWLWAFDGTSYRLDFTPHSAEAPEYEVVVWDLGRSSHDLAHAEPTTEERPLGRTTWRASPGTMNYPPDADALGAIIGIVVAASE